MAIEVLVSGVPDPILVETGGPQGPAGAPGPAPSGTGMVKVVAGVLQTPQPLGLNLVTDNATHHFQFTMATTTGIVGAATGTPVSGAWQMYTSITASSALIHQFNLYNLLPVDYSKRIILKFMVGEPRYNIALLFQIGRNGTSTKAKITNKGFGLELINGIVRAYVHDGVALTLGADALRAGHRIFIMDFIPGVRLDVYGTAHAPGNLICSVTSGLPSALALYDQQMFEIIKYDTGAGGLADFLLVGPAQISIF